MSLVAVVGPPLIPGLPGACLRRNTGLTFLSWVYLGPLPSILGILGTVLSVETVSTFFLTGSPSAPWLRVFPCPGGLAVNASLAVSGRAGVCVFSTKRPPVCTPSSVDGRHKHSLKKGMFQYRYKRISCRYWIHEVVHCASDSFWNTPLTCVPWDVGLYIHNMLLSILPFRPP